LFLVSKAARKVKQTFNFKPVSLSVGEETGCGQFLIAGGSEEIKKIDGRKFCFSNTPYYYCRTGPAENQAILHTIINIDSSFYGVFKTNKSLTIFGRHHHREASTDKCV
jgi:hypothetical protein